MSLKNQTKQSLPEFDRAAVFAEVDNSNRRFDDYSKEQRAAFAQQVRSAKTGAIRNEVRRARH